MVNGAGRRIWAVARKEIIQISRDSRILLWAFGLPAALLLIFGYAITLDINAVPTIVVDPTPSLASREIVRSLKSSGYFSIRWQLTADRPIGALFEADQARIALVFPNDFADAVARGAASKLQVLVDGADNNTALIAMGYLQKVLVAYNTQALVEQAVRLGAGQTVKTPVLSESRVWYNPELKSRNFIIPGLLSIILGVMTVVLTALCVAREHERGTFEQLIVSPLGRFEFMLGKLIPYYAIGLLEFLMVVLVGRFLFDVPIKGSFLEVLLSSMLFLMAGLGQGLLISIATKSQQLAMQVGLLSALLPSILLSGFMFPIDSMPSPIQWISIVIPARHLLTVLRALMLKGVDLSYLVPSLLFLGTVATIFFSIAFRKLQKRVG